MPDQRASVSRACSRRKLGERLLGREQPRVSGTYAWESKHNAQAGLHFV